LDLLGDPDRCSVVLVTHAEETSVNEVVVTAFHLEERVGVKLGPVVVNGVVRAGAGLGEPPARAATAAGRRLRVSDRERLADAATSTLREAERHARQLDQLRDRLPLPRLVVGRAPVASRGDRLAGYLAAELTAA